MSEHKKPKYLVLKEYLIDQINSGILQPGKPIFSENELAAKFQISRHTVRQALGELVNESWLYRVHGKGTYVREKRIRREQSKNIGVITTYLNDYIFPSIIRGIDSVLAVNGYTMALGCTYNQHDRELLCLENMLNQNIDGLIVEPTKSVLPNPNLELYQELLAKGVQLLFIHGKYQDLACSYLAEDDTEAGVMAAKHLIGLGHRRIGGIFKVDDVQGHFRWVGFQKAHREAGIRILDSHILWFDTAENDEPDFFARSGRLEHILEECSALVCYNDQIALRVLDIIRAKGLNVPENISLVSFDDSQLAVSSEVKLTTVAHPKEKLGMRAAEIMLDLVEKGKGDVALKMVPELIVRSSTQRIDEKISI